MRPPLASQLLEFGRTIRLSHSLFALPFALGAALLAEPPYPDGWSLALLAACMVAARTAAMGMNRVADASLDARNPRTADRAIPAGRLSRRTALALAILSGAAFIGLAWLFVPLRQNRWPGLLAPAFLVVLVGYSWTKRLTWLTHWLLGLALGLSPVGVWVALRGAVSVVALMIGAGVLFWTAGFDILYALQDVEVDRRERLHSAAARLGRAGALKVALASHVVALLLLAPVALTETGQPRLGWLGLGSLAALVAIGVELALQHIRARHAGPEQIAAAFFSTNALVSMMWLVGVVLDVIVGLRVRVFG
jgi:4-hydroxybenzoate polyprenyltransferase